MGLFKHFVVEPTVDKIKDTGYTIVEGVSESACIAVADTVSEMAMNLICDGLGGIQNKIREHQYKAASKEVKKILGDLEDKEMEEDMVSYWIMLGEQIGIYAEKYEK